MAVAQPTEELDRVVRMHVFGVAAETARVQVVPPTRECIVDCGEAIGPFRVVPCHLEVR